MIVHHNYMSVTMFIVQATDLEGGHPKSSLNQLTLTYPKTDNGVNVIKLILSVIYQFS
jgi:hypothetical protein